MPTFSSDGIEIYYEEAGIGEPIILVHGFASSLVRNWKDVGWFTWLNETGYKVIALDCRGHGKSEKLYDKDDYSETKMSGDVINLMDHLGLESAVLMGYSMGSFITGKALRDHGPRIRKAVLAGVGGSRNIVSSAISEAMLTEDPADIQDAAAKTFRTFADKSGADRKALAAYMQTGRPTWKEDELAGVTVPVLVVAGEKDDLVGDPQVLADYFPYARAVIVPRRNHLNTVGDKVYREAVIAFLAE